MQPQKIGAPAGKLGLSLAGGGFRAALFHIGVLRRLAEFDLLRRVEVLSTVSGGSITGALYLLLLKKHLERTKRNELGLVRLPCDEYVQLVDELEAILVAGVRKNLRTRLLMNPLGVLLVIITGDSLGRRMARIYERYLLHHVVRELGGLQPSPWWLPRRLWRGQMRMAELRVKPGNEEISDLSAYNARQREQGGSVVTNLVVNATSLNSGGRFHFSAAELGDWYLGYFREDEFDELLSRKELLKKGVDLGAIAKGSAPPPVKLPGVEDATGKRGAERPYDWKGGEAGRAAALALRRREPRVELSGDEWAALFAIDGFPGLIDGADFGLLRRAKVPAWYVREMRDDRSVRGGRTRAQHEACMWDALEAIDSDVQQKLKQAVAENATLLATLAEYVIELYLQRSAVRVSPNIHDEWKSIRVGHAVGASACFPPVFPPFLFYGIYDDRYVPRLGLTDGGVYDNTGVTALLDEGCTEIIASDTGGVFHLTPSSASGNVGLALRLPDLLMRALGGVQRLWLRERRRVSRALSKEIAASQQQRPPRLPLELCTFHAQRTLDELVYFQISSPTVQPERETQDPPDPPAVPALTDLGFDPGDVAKLRTDLDGFGDVEVAALVNRGYDLTDRYVRHYRVDLLKDSGFLYTRAEAPYTFGASVPPDRVRHVLEVGSARFFRALKLHRLLATGYVVAAIGGIVAAVVIWQITLASVASIGATLLAVETAFIGTILPFILKPAGFVLHSPAVLAGVVGAGGIVFLKHAWWPPKPAAPGEEPVARVLPTARKWARAFSGNVLWLALALPAVFALAASLLANVSYYCFHLPFMRLTALPKAARLMRVGGSGPGASSQGDGP